MNEYGISSISGFAEPVSSWTHLAGACVFAVLGIRLLRRAWQGNPSHDRDVHPMARVCFVAIFATAVVLQLAVSGAYHLMPFESGARSLFLIVDYAVIFILIAATLTPSYGILFRGWQRWIPLVLIWGAAAAGIGLRTYFYPGISPWVGVSIYLAMGWVGVLGAAQLWRRFGPSFIEPLLLGAAAYTAGAAIQLAGQPTLVHGIVGPHELTHFAVLLGVASHWMFISRFAAGRPLVESSCEESLALEAAAG